MPADSQHNLVDDGDFFQLWDEEELITQSRNLRPSATVTSQRSRQSGQPTFLNEAELVAARDQALERRCARLSRAGFVGDTQLEESQSEQLAELGDTQLEESQNDVGDGSSEAEALGSRQARIPRLVQSNSAVQDWFKEFAKPLTAKRRVGDIYSIPTIRSAESTDGIPFVISIPAGRTPPWPPLKASAFDTHHIIHMADGQPISPGVLQRPQVPKHCCHRC